MTDSLLVPPRRPPISDRSSISFRSLLYRRRCMSARVLLRRRQTGVGRELDVTYCLSQAFPTTPCAYLRCLAACIAWTWLLGSGESMGCSTKNVCEQLSITLRYCIYKQRICVNPHVQMLTLRGESER